MRVVIESPLAGDTVRNLRFALWCARACWLKEGVHAIASHTLNPWFMDDEIAAERAAGIDNPWVWCGSPHWFFVDLGISSGMKFAQERCDHDVIRSEIKRLEDYAPECWAAFQRGEFPPHTRGFEIATEVSR